LVSNPCFSLEKATSKVSGRWDFGGRISAHRLNMHKKKIVLPAPAFGRRMPT
jgi:hypothetical protein